MEWKWLGICVDVVFTYSFYLRSSIRWQTLD